MEEAREGEYTAACRQDSIRNTQLTPLLFVPSSGHRRRPLQGRQGCPPCQRTAHRPHRATHSGLQGLRASACMVTLYNTQTSAICNFVIVYLPRSSSSSQQHSQTSTFESVYPEVVTHPKFTLSDRQLAKLSLHTQQSMKMLLKLWN